MEARCAFWLRLLRRTNSRRNQIGFWVVVMVVLGYCSGFWVAIMVVLGCCFEFWVAVLGSGLLF
ncbi:hypothetical protein LR48_Vigan11g107100 [Vigna angularis]|uniref:Transmembrane protein n=1 Tax=Phaseolus angularis TaxID=3914 RepID=A0A0L9VSX0_PHAAN|nr:hypothetical protein LR48_Vigan11g107100 [Vigna angularis]